MPCSRRFSWLGVLGLILCANQAMAQQELDPELEQRVNAILDALDPSDEKQIAESEKELVALGPEASLVFDKIADDVSDETKQLLSRVQAAWNEHRTQELLRPTKINLSGSFTLAKALAEIGKQANLKIIGAEEDGTPMDLSLKDLDFWKALDQVTLASPWRMYPYGGEEGELRLVESREQPSAAPPIAYAGPFRIEALRCEAVRDYGQPSASQLRVVLGLQWEPRLKPIAFLQAAKDVVAVGDTSEVELVPQNSEAVIEASVQPEIPFAEMALPYKLVDPSATQISQLSGTLFAMIPSPPASFEFSELDNDSPGKEIRQGGLVVRLESLGAEDTIFAVRVRLTFDNANGALESFRSWINTSEIELQDGMGTTYKPIGSELSLVGESEASIRALFSQDPQTLNLVVRSPTNIYRIPIKFDLHNLILP